MSGSVVIIILAGASLAKPSLFKFNSSQATDSLEEVAGETQSVQNDIRRKSLNSLSWDGLSDNSNVYFNDSIYSGNDSEVSIFTSKGTSFRLEPNSLIFLEKDNGQIAVDIKLGGMQADLKQGESVILKSEGFSTQVRADADDTQLKLLKESQTQTSVVVQKGRAAAITNNESRALSTREKVTLDQKLKKADVSKIEIQLLQPRNNETIWLKPEAAALLQWKAEGSGSRQMFHITVSKKRDFSDPVYNATTMESYVRVRPLNRGIYFWRVSTDASQHSERGLFRIKTDVPPALYFPADKSIVIADSVQLLWQNPGEAKKFRLQVAKDPQFSRFLVNESIDQHEYRLSSLPTGEYFWRVQTEEGGLKSTSEIFAFQWKHPETEKPVAADKKETASSVATAAATPEPPPTITTVTTTTSSTTSSTTSTMTPTTTTTSTTTTNPPLPSTTTTTLAAQKPPVHLPAPSMKVASTTICKPLPEACPAVELSMIESLPSQTKLKIEIANDSKFSETIKTISSQSHKIEVRDLKEGSYFLRASLLGKDGKSVSPVSKTVGFKIERERPPALPAPELQAPPNDTNIVLFGDKMAPLLFKWSAVKNAEFYVIQLATAADFKSVWNEQKTTAPNFILKSNPKTQKLHWRVKAVAKDHEATWSPAQVVNFED
jgi:hypothetical protein